MDFSKWLNANINSNSITNTNAQQQPDTQNQPNVETNHNYGYQIEERGILENADTKTMSLDSPGGEDDE